MCPFSIQSFIAIFLFIVSNCCVPWYSELDLVFHLVFILSNFLCSLVFRVQLAVSRGIHSFTVLCPLVFWVRSHAPSIQSHRGTKVVWPDFQPMRVPEEPVCIDLFWQNPVFTSLHLKSPVHVHRLWISLSVCAQRRWTWTGDFKCREVKTGFCRNRSMQTGSSGTLIGWKSGQTTFVPLWDWMEGAWPRTLVFKLLTCCVSWYS